MRKPVLRRVSVVVESLTKPVEAWLGFGKEWHWNGFPQPAMTAAQLDAFIKAQPPGIEKQDSDYDVVFFDKQNGFGIMHDGACEPLEKLKVKTPSGEDLYDMGNCWCWEIEENELVAG